MTPKQARFPVAFAGSNKATISIIGQIGKSWWDDSGTDEADFRAVLDSIPRGTQIEILINSEGGSIKDGLGIYHAIKDRSEDIVCKVTGYALSIASVFPCAASKFIAPKTSIVMIHKPWTYAEGDATAMRQTAEMLDKHEGALIEAYTRKTGKTADEIKAALVGELGAGTWMTGEEAVTFGLCDMASDEDTSDAQAKVVVPENFRSKAPSRFAAALNSARRLPDAVTEAAPTAAQEQEGTTMDKQNTTPAPAAEPKAAPAQNTAPPGDNAEVLNRVKALEAQNAALRREKLERIVDNAIAERRITNANRAFFIEQGERTSLEAVAENLATFEPRNLDPVASSPVVVLAADPKDTGRGILNLVSGSRRIWRENGLDDSGAKAMARNSIELSKAFSDPKFSGWLAQNANSIDSNLQTVSILQTAMSALAKRIIALRAFSTVFENVPLLGTDEVVVPYYPAFTTASTNWSATDGYTGTPSDTISSKKVTINKRKYQFSRFTSSEIARQPYLNKAELAKKHAEQLGIDVFTDVLSAVTLATYGAASVTSGADAFDLDDVTDLMRVADDADWPELGRSLFLTNTYKANLLKQQGLVSVSESGSPQALRDGMTGRLLGFDVYANSRIPSNSENLVGFISVPSALIVATAPVTPTAAVLRQLAEYQVYTDAATGISFTYKLFGSADYDRETEIIECNYGYIAGETAALKRITSA
jgi:ATP-dependent protease ClpP protease subunit